MPYKIIGKKVYHKKGGKWKVKQTASSTAKARATVRLLRGIEHGYWRPTGKKTFTRVKKHRRKGRRVKKHRRRLRCNKN